MFPIAVPQLVSASAACIPLELHELALPLAERLARAAARQSGERTAANGTPFVLRTEQARVFSSFADYLLEVATRPDHGVAPSPFCRIILPPRTGKTVIAGHIIGRSGLTATVVVPTRTLVWQTQRVIGEMLPGVPVGTWTGEAKAPVENGVNVTTYSMLLRSGVPELPGPLRNSALVFADEAHRAMTPARIGLLREAFTPGAIRIGLTATPDYDDDRRLSRFFPDLIHEVPLPEALELGLLAPVRVWVAEVDEDGSVVRLSAGEYEQHTLGRLMSAAPFFKAALHFRYAEANASRGALLCCATRQQAFDLFRFFQRHRPPRTPEPALLLGETPSAEREEALAHFEAGCLDTLIQVGVLIEGWSSPRCKVLVDLAPSVSRVRATQKYFRAMTRDGDAEARLYVLLPKDLPELPTLPMDLLGAPGGEYECGTLLGGEPAQTSAPSRAIEEHVRTPIQGVRLRHRVLLEAALKKPALQRGDLRGLRWVLASCPDFDMDAPCGRFRFRSLLFQHRLFVGRGQFLLEWLGFPPTDAGYAAFLAAACPEAVANQLLAESGMGEYSVCREWCVEDAIAVDEAMCRIRRAGATAAGEAWEALGGHRAHEALPPDAPLIALDDRRRLDSALSELKARHLSVLERRFGLSGEEPRTLAQLGEEEQVTRERVREIAKLGLRYLGRHLVVRAEWEESRVRQERQAPVSQPLVYRLPEMPPSRREQALCSLVVGALADAGLPLPPSDIGQRVGLDHVHVAAATRRLLRQGAIRSTSDGYALTSRPATKL